MGQRRGRKLRTNRDDEKKVAEGKGTGIEVTAGCGSPACGFMYKQL